MKKIGLKHFNYLIDDFSIWQHTSGHKIDSKHGYALDDAARALILALKIEDFEKAKTLLNFLEVAISDGAIVNFFDKNRRPLKKPWSEDALGETYWSLAECVVAGFETKKAKKIIRGITKDVKEFKSPRSVSYAIIGASLIDLELANQLITELYKQYQNNSSPEWEWLEDSLTYANSIIPYAFLSAGTALKKPSYRDAGIKMLRFLNSVTKEDEFPIAIGNKGWYQKNGKKAMFDQQPIEAGYQVIANLAAWEITSDEEFLNQAKIYFSWFWGNNISEISLIDEEDHTCADGLWRNGVDDNSGAESIVCFLWAQEEIWPLLTKYEKEALATSGDRIQITDNR